MSVEIKSCKDITNLIGKEIQLKIPAKVFDIIAHSGSISEYSDAKAHKSAKEGNTLCVVGFGSAVDSYGVEANNLERLFEKFNEFTLDETSFTFEVLNPEDEVFEIDSELIDSIF